LDGPSSEGTEGPTYSWSVPVNDRHVTILLMSHVKWSQKVVYQICKAVPDSTQSVNTQLVPTR